MGPNRDGHRFRFKQSCRIWSDDNPPAIVDVPLHPQKVIFWCALWVERIIGTYFFENETDYNFIERYRVMINDFFVPELEDVM